MASLDPANPAKKPHNGYERQTRPTPPERILTCSVRKKYGAVEIEFGVSAPYFVEYPADQERAWSLLYGQVSDMHEQWAKESLPYVPFLDRKEDGAINTYPAILMYTDTTDSGEQRRRIKTAIGTPFHKYGVTVYPEMWDRIARAKGFTFGLLATPLDNLEITVETTKGKHRITDFNIVNPQA